MGTSKGLRVRGGLRTSGEPIYGLPCKRIGGTFVGGFLLGGSEVSNVAVSAAMAATAASKTSLVASVG